MADETRKQKTTPKGIDPKTGKPYEPIEIPVPRRRDFEDMLKRAAKPSRSNNAGDQNQI
jgi:hypothetical protein